MNSTVKADGTKLAPAFGLYGPAKAPLPPRMTREILFRSVFDSIDTKQKGSISQHDLVKAMRSRRSSVELIFGASGTAQALTAFQKLDKEGKGAVDFRGFLTECEDAFRVREADEGGYVIHPAAGPAYASEIPTPPPMTRELLFR